MTKCLQELFIESRGESVQVGQQYVVQRDLIPVKYGNVTVRFLGQPEGIHGVVFKSIKGGVTLSDGSVVRTVHIWDETELPREVTHHVECPDGKLSVWNIYRTKHRTGEITEDYFTGNAGMVVICKAPKVRRYNCSAGPGPFDPEQFLFEIRW